MHEQHNLPRRTFLKTLGCGTAALAFVPSGRAEDAPAPAKTKNRVGVRPFGRSGRDVSMLSLGGMFDITSNQLLLRAAYEQGVTYWDTADCYNGGKSEEGIGLFFEKYPERRKDIFLVTKSDARDPEGMTRLLTRSLERMKTDHIDLYFLHGVGRIEELTDGTRRWAEQAKKDGKILLFGFSTHKNMEDCLLGAPALGYIDGIMVKYNFRSMHTPRMKEAVEACARAGIGLTAMKTQAGGPVKMESEAANELAARLLERGFTEGQAKLKVVWEMPHFASICSQMPNLNLLMSNVAAALDVTKLSALEHALFRQYAEETRSSFCAGCAAHCEAVAGGWPVCDMLRGLMYERDYGDRNAAASIWRTLTPQQRQGLAQVDLSAAERACPQGLALSTLLREAMALA